jgi:hypothetical protein
MTSSIGEYSDHPSMVNLADLHKNLFKGNQFSRDQPYKNKARTV